MSSAATITHIDAQALTYLPAVIAGIQAAEAAAPDAPGQQKFDAVMQGIAAGSGALEASPNPSVAGIAALINMSVMIFNLLGAFKKKPPAVTAAAAQ